MRSGCFYFIFVVIFFFFFFFTSKDVRANFDDAAMDGSRCVRKKGRGKGTRTRMRLYVGVERALEIRHTFHFLERLRFPSWLQILEISRLVQFQPRDHRFEPILLTESEKRCPETLVVRSDSSRFNKM